jgi:palmitoyl-protein thioesterase
MVKAIAAIACAAGLAATASAATNPYPTVTAHGMGDSCFNGGMQQITALIGKATGSYAKCIPTGNAFTDATNSFLVIFFCFCGGGSAFD